MTSRSHFEIYAENATAFLRYRTGLAIDVPAANTIMSRMHEIGYFQLAAGELLVLLINEDAAALTSKPVVEKMLKVVLDAASFKRVRELIVVPVATSSGRRVNALKTLRGQLNDRVDRETVLVRVQDNGLFAFNAVARPQFAIRREIAANVASAREFASPEYRGSRVHLTTFSLNADEKNKYREMLNSWSQIPGIPENNSFCVWNGYREGDIIAIEELSMQALAPTNIRRVTAPVLPKDEADVDETE